MSFVTPTSDPHHDHSVRRRIKEIQKEIKKIMDWGTQKSQL